MGNETSKKEKNKLKVSGASVPRNLASTSSQNKRKQQVTAQKEEEKQQKEDQLESEEEEDEHEEEEQEEEEEEEEETLETTNNETNDTTVESEITIVSNKDAVANKNVKEIANNIEWQLDDAIYVFSNSLDQYLPAIIIEISDDKKDLTCQYWDTQSLELKYKIIPCNASQNVIKNREYTTQHDPWLMPKSNILPNDIINDIKRSLADKSINIADIDINQWFLKFKSFLQNKKGLRRKNPFIRLISSYLGEDINSWSDILFKFIETIIVFEQTNKINHKIEILFNILNVGSEHIDTESLQIVCIMYSKCIMNEQMNNGQNHDKNKIAQFANKLMQKIIEEDNEIDIDEFTTIIKETRDMHNIIKASIKEAILTERTLQ